MSDKEIKNLSEFPDSDCLNKGPVNNQKKLKKFICDLCNKSYVSKASLKSHIQNELIKNEPTSRQCAYCKKFLLLADYPEHVEQKHQILRCGTCTKVFFNTHSFKRHQRDHKASKLSCDICNSQFLQKESLKHHMLSIHLRAIPRSKCEQCGSMVITRNLERHIAMVHQKQQDHVCEVCRKPFKTRAQLREHLAAIHLKQKNFACNICNRKYPYRRTLTQHTNEVHGAKLIHKCELCERTFTSSASNFQKHVKKHEERPFSCPHSSCKSMFATKEALEKHIARSTESHFIKYYCGKCFKEYSSVETLRCHVNTEHLGLAYECHFCGKKYSDKKNVKKHMFKNHIEN